jgi:uncharacterized protein YkwD
MSQATAYEQFMLELVNREQAKTGAQPLAFNGNLNASADSHSTWMIATDTFSHTGSGSWSSGENIAWVSTAGRTAGRGGTAAREPDEQPGPQGQHPQRDLP